MSGMRELLVFLAASCVITASTAASFGVVDARAEQAGAIREARMAALDSALLLEGEGSLEERSPPASTEPRATSTPNMTTPEGSPTSAAPSSASPAPPPAVAPAPTSKPTNATAKPTPPPDKDRDRIPDAKDKCPSRSETRNGYLDTDGCPDVITTTRVS